EVGILRAAQKGLKVKDARRAVVEHKTELVTGDVFRLGHFQILCRCRFHFSLRVMTSGLLCFFNTKKSTQRFTMSSAFSRTSFLKSFKCAPVNGRRSATLRKIIRTTFPSLKTNSALHSCP